MKIENGWVLYSADFSCKASGANVKGWVMLVRDQHERKKWHLMSDEMKEVIELYVKGFGDTIEEAIDDANFIAANSNPILIKDIC